MKDPRDIILKPHISEKSMSEIEKSNTYTFKVALNANKTEVKKAIEEIFKVKVLQVSTCRMPGKTKRMGVFVGTTPSWKKAMVRLADGDRIEIFEGV